MEIIVPELKSYCSIACTGSNTGKHYPRHKQRNMPESVLLTKLLPAACHHADQQSPSEAFAPGLADAAAQWSTPPPLPIDQKRQDDSDHTLSLCSLLRLSRGRSDLATQVRN